MDMPLPFVVGCDLAGVVEKRRPGRKAIQSRRPRVGHQPGAARPAGHVRRVRGRRRRLALSHARRRQRRNGRRLRAGRHHRPPGPGPRRQAARPAKRCSSTAARAASARWSCRWPRRSARASSPRPAATRKCTPAASSAPMWPSTTRPKTSHARVKESAPRRRQRLVGDAPRAGLRPDRAAAGPARPDDPHGRPRRPPAVSRRPVLRQGLPLHGFAMFNATPDEQRAAADDINRWLAAGKLKPASTACCRSPRPPPPIACKKKTRRQSGHAGGQDRNQAIGSPRSTRRTQRRDE